MDNKSLISKEVQTLLRKEGFSPKVYEEAVEKYGNEFGYDRIHQWFVKCKYHWYTKSSLEQHLRDGCPKCQAIRENGRDDHYIEMLFNNNRFSVLTDME